MICLINTMTLTSEVCSSASCTYLNDEKTRLSVIIAVLGYAI